MNCSIVKDLIPLYIDDCCSAETREAVRQHLAECPECQRLFADMSASAPEQPCSPREPMKPGRINDWKASILQSVLLFLSFLAITIGVASEARMPSGFGNGFWAFSVVVPATGFMLSLAHWYFVRLYKSRRNFSWMSCAVTLAATLGGFLFSCLHYELTLVYADNLMDILETLPFYSSFLGPGALLTVVSCVLSKVMSGQYAKMLGKE